MIVMEAFAYEDESPVDRLLREQNRLQTPVTDFSRKYEQLNGHRVEAFRSLIPLDNPAPGEQFAFEVDLDRCSGCKACVTACHSLNGLDEHETWRDVGLIHGLKQDKSYQQTITTACHHCVDPGCLNGCPVNAYEKDEQTGIVLHLDDQCIGCQYCVWKCPYDVPKYNERLGIVRKCDMCHSRLSVGEAPACVQACPTEAIRITKVDQTATIDAARTAGTPSFLPDAPHQDYTVPTTAYVTEREIPATARAADIAAVRPQHVHWPLVWMLTLTQVSVGLSAALALTGKGSLLLPLAAAASGVVGMTASVLHLGRPLQAWRAFLGLGHSWLSREIFAFGGFAALLLAAFTSTLFSSSTAPALWITTAVAGAFAVFTSVMIYHDTRRVFWRFSRTAVRFFGTVAMAAGAGMMLLDSPMVGIVTVCAALMVKGFFECRIITRAGHATISPDTQSARIQLEHELPAFLIRWLASGFGTVCLMASGGTNGWIFICGLILLFTGELAERYLFFTAVDAPKMPGGIAA